MTEDKLNEQLREAATARARASEPGELDLERVAARANAIRRRRSARVAGAAILGLAVVIGGVYATQGDSDRQGGQIAVDPTKSVSTSPTPDTSPTAPPANTKYQTLLTQLQDMPEVRANLLAPVRDGQIVLCGINVQGQNETQHQIFALLVCGLFSTGPDAESISAGGDPVVITTDGRGGPEATVVDVEFPGMANRTERIRQMFPPDLVDTMTSPQDLDYRPTLEEMLTAAQGTTT